MTHVEITAHSRMSASDVQDHPDAKFLGRRWGYAPGKRALTVVAFLSFPTILLLRAVPDCFVWQAVAIIVTLLGDLKGCQGWTGVAEHRAKQKAKQSARTGILLRRIW